MMKVNDSTHWLRILKPKTHRRLGRIRQAIFDFDGTLSLLRQGWEEVMIPLMVEMICGEVPPSPAIWQEVCEYVDQSTGILTIRQMEWLAQTVRRHGLSLQVKEPAEYKAIYLRRLMERIHLRLEGLASGKIDPDDEMLAGARAFLKGLRQAGVSLYLVSGTDHADVLSEASALGTAALFDGGIYGALDGAESNDKAVIVQRVLSRDGLQGDELLVVGDGPVEMRAAVERGALALGVASDEVARSGWNVRKVERLARAGADFLIPDFSHTRELLDFLFC